MKIIIYYLSLLIFLAILTGYVIAQQNSSEAMGMSTMIGVSASLIAYTLAMSLVGEGNTEDERGMHHRKIANRVAAITGTIILSIAIIYQVTITHDLDYWLLVALGGINLSKIISLIYLNYKK